MMNFDQKVWEIAKKIPKGKVTTYKEIARKLNTKAYMAVGNALNRNPHGFLSGGNVPCHRVVKSDGSIGGFAHGTAKKIMLLKKEGIRIKDSKADPGSIFHL
ncbi:methylated-DNA--[protein]-cysteine S-methyltransferase [Candidatus Woesearchaeota archaeon]|nr:methylated-DNA--[protein]-cysteine S-methyltransferase [Candidatus Woesearchaeota archaeon]